MNPQFKKGFIEMCILSMICSHTEMYGYAIIERIREGFGDTPEATIYLSLKRLDEHGYIKYVTRRSEAGPPRKYYSLTDAGAQQLEKLKNEWELLKNTINKYI